MIVRANNADLSVVRIFAAKPAPATFYALKEGDFCWQVDVDTGRFHRFLPLKSYHISAAKIADVPAERRRFFVAFIEGRRKVAPKGRAR